MYKYTHKIVIIFGVAPQKPVGLVCHKEKILYILLKEHHGYIKKEITGHFRTTGKLRGLREADITITIATIETVALTNKLKTKP